MQRARSLARWDETAVDHLSNSNDNSLQLAAGDEME